MLFMLLCVVVFIALAAFGKYRSIKAGMAMGAQFVPPPTAVTTVAVKAQTWQPVLHSVGSLRAVNGVTVSTDLAGIVSEIGIESGTEVKKGASLVKLDTRQEEAQVRNAEARLELATTDLARKKDLLAKKAIAQSDWDSAVSQLDQMKASVEDARALVARKHVIAPFDGFVGIRQVDLGQYLQPGAPIVSLQSLDPIQVDFALPQQHFDAIVVGKKLRLAANGIEGEKFEGEITAVDSRVDASTRNVMVQGTIKNPDHKLRPGMFVDVEVLLPEQDGVLAIPASAISYAPYGDSVFVVRAKPDANGKPGKEVEQHFIKIGPKRGDQVSVTQGLKDGDEVVSSGVFKLRPGQAVQVDNSVQPSNELQPKPADS